MKTNKSVILVVEDRENWRETFCGLLEDYGYDVIQATCGEEFRENAEKADVIMLDISMPMTKNGDEIKTTGLDILIDLQEKFPFHKAIQSPIIRSMWERHNFIGTKYYDVKVRNGGWCSRNKPNADLLALVEDKLENLE